MEVNLEESNREQISDPFHELVETLGEEVTIQVSKMDRDPLQIVWFIFIVLSLLLFDQQPELFRWKENMLSRG